MTSEVIEDHIRSNLQNIHIFLDVISFLFKIWSYQNFIWNFNMIQILFFYFLKFNLKDLWRLHTLLNFVKKVVIFKNYEKGFVILKQKFAFGNNHLHYYGKLFFYLYLLHSTFNSYFRNLNVFYIVNIFYTLCSDIIFKKIIKKQLI